MKPDEPLCPDVTAVIAEDEKLRNQAAIQPIGQSANRQVNSPVAIVTAVKTFAGSHETTIHDADVRWIQSNKPVELGAELYLRPSRSGTPSVSEFIAMFERLTMDEQNAFYAHMERHG